MPDPDDVSAAREDRRRRTVFDERLEFAVNHAHAAALALPGFGSLRFASDPVAASAGPGRPVPMTAGSPAVEGAATHFRGDPRLGR